MAFTCRIMRDQFFGFLLRELHSDLSLETLIQSHLKHCAECSPVSAQFLEALMLLALPMQAEVSTPLAKSVSSSRLNG